MSSITWTNTTSGNWNTGSNWSGGAEPGAADDVTISTSQAITVTYSTGNDAVLSLYTGGNDTLSVTGGKLQVNGNSSLYGAVSQTNGSLILAGGRAFMNSGLQQAGGTVDIASGYLTIGGAGSTLNGTITGSTLILSAGTDNLGASSVLSVAALDVSGANVNLAGNLTQAGVVDVAGGTLAIGGNTLTLSGTTGLTGGVISGSGSVVLSGATELGNFAFEGTEAVTNSGTITQTNSTYFGYNGTDSVSFTNTATGVWRIGGDFVVYGNANTALVNQGTIVKTGGTGRAYIQDSLASNGTLTVGAGLLQLNGANDVLTGTVNGAGTLEITSGATKLGPGLTLGVGGMLLDGAAVTLGGALTYANSWAQTAGTLSLGGFALTLSGAAALDGGIVTGAGTLALSGSNTELSGTVLEGSIAVSNTGTTTQSGSFYIGYNSTDTVKFTNAATGLYRLESGQAIYATAAGSFANAGTLEKTGSGVANINASLSNTGTIKVDGGALVLQGGTATLGGTVSGTGVLALNASASTIAKGLKLLVGNTQLEAGVLTMGENLTYAGNYLQSAGTLALGKFTFLDTASVTLDSGVVNGTGVLAVKTAAINGLALEGSATLKNIGTLTVASSFYDGYNSGDTAHILNAGAASLVRLANNATIYATAGSTFVNTGTIEKIGGAGISLIAANLTSTGKISVDLGTLRVQGASNSIGGAVLGAGTLEMNAGADTLASGLTMTVAGLLLDGATVTLGGALTYAGAFDQTTGTLALGGNTLTLSGNAQLAGGSIGQSGTVVNTGALTVSNSVLTGSTVLQNGGTLAEAGSLYVGYNGTDTVQLQNLAAGLYRLENNATMFGTAGSLFSNAGTLVKTGGGTATIQVNFTNTGSVSILGGGLTLSGPNETLGGTISGAGGLTLAAGAVTISAGASLATGNLALSGATVNLGGAETYGGVFIDTTGTLALGGNTLTLNGAASFGGGVANGSGTVALAGTSTMLGAFAFEGSVQVANSGTLNVLSGFFVGYNTTDTATLRNSGTLNMGSVGISGQAGDTVVNSGTIAKALGAGIGFIQPGLTNTGTVSVSQGTLSFLGVVGGAGHFSIGTGSEMIFAAAASGGAVTMGAFADLAVNATAGFTDTIGGFSAGDIIDLNGIGWTGTLTTFNFAATTDKLTVSNGTNAITLQLAGSYTNTSFALFSDNGTTAIHHT
jgi:hypothetical protein